MNNDIDLVQSLEHKFRFLQEETQQLRVELGILRTNIYGSGIDTVILDDLVLYMPTNDNIYSNFVHNNNKNYAISAYGLPKIGADNLTTDAARALCNYIGMVAEECGAVDLFDIGAWVGDVAIRLGRYAKLMGLNYRGHCYDPSFAGALVPFNTQINRVSDVVDFTPAGISLQGGPLLFHQVRGHSDSSGLSTMESFGRPVDAYIVNTYTLKQILAQHSRPSHRIIKIDVEGLDALIVRQNLAEVTDSTIIMEFNPTQKQYAELNPIHFLEYMAITHTLYDLFYAPKPTRVAKIEDYHAFAMEVAQRPHRYSDILMVPRTRKFNARFDEASKLYTQKPDHCVFADPFCPL
ncbi:FkbM family methyltransferase [Methylobacterium sp. NMS12]|uniref:FkbM family methyltransferase n=1 Tax=Methylobacterium sp. NMS12 TaxID=3079766 RepID=UPI003F883E07